MLISARQEAKCRQYLFQLSFVQDYYIGLNNCHSSWDKTTVVSYGGSKELQKLAIGIHIASLSWSRCYSIWTTIVYFSMILSMSSQFAFVSILSDQQAIQSEIGQDTMDEQSLLMVDNVLIYEDYVSSHGWSLPTLLLPTNRMMDQSRHWMIYQLYYRTTFIMRHYTSNITSSTIRYLTTALPYHHVLQDQVLE